MSAAIAASVAASVAMKSSKKVSQSYAGGKLAAASAHRAAVEARQQSRGIRFARLFRGI